jgi:hypothetical protein
VKPIDVLCESRLIVQQVRIGKGQDGENHCDLPNENGRRFVERRPSRQPRKVVILASLT